MNFTWEPLIKPPHPSSISRLSSDAEKVLKAITKSATRDNEVFDFDYDKSKFREPANLVNGEDNGHEMEILNFEDRMGQMTRVALTHTKKGSYPLSYPTEIDRFNPSICCKSLKPVSDCSNVRNGPNKIVASPSNLLERTISFETVSGVRQLDDFQLFFIGKKPILEECLRSNDVKSENEVHSVVFPCPPPRLAPPLPCYRLQQVVMEFCWSAEYPGGLTMPSNKSVVFATLMLRGSLNTITSTTESVSPVTLSSDWSRVGRLLLLTALSVSGSIGNVFMISAVMIEDHLKKKGNSFLVNLALADILITGLVIPASIVVILADLTDSKSVVCNFQWFLALVSCLVSVLTIFVVALENYSRLCMSPDCYSSLTPCKITLIIIFIWIASCTAVTIQTVLDLGPDYCNGKTHGLVRYQIAIGIIFVFIPALLTCVCYSLIVCRVRMYKAIPSFRPPVTFTFDYELMKTNLYGFIFFIIFWLPFGITLSLGSVQTISQKVLYTLAWLALTKSCFLNFLYCITNRHFRNAYINLFHYCCCKTISFSRRSREPVRPTGDVRVHIIPGYNMYSYTSPQRAREANKTSCKRITSGTCRPTTSRPNGRDVYEL